ncbi:MAG: hypothetical protein GWO24_10390, partial [Akkermansiaceae bacterium]|nr:hypothetical protein [Akkermansiaceae bacterium]NIT80243.1 hypothetical protein [Thermoplasmata archaeon]NIY06611.1 hypothetical protein [Thermoplasmata archaeon]
TAFQLPTDAEYDLDPEFTFIITCDGGRVSFTGREIFEILRRLRHEHDAAVERARKDALCARCGERPRIGDTHP